MPGTAGLCLARTRSLGLREGEELAPEATNLPKSPAGELLGGHPAAWKGRDGADPAAHSAGPCSRRLGCAAAPRGAAGGCSRRRLGHARLSRWMLIHAAALAKPAAARPRMLLTPGAVIWQGRLLPPPAQVLPSVSIPEGSSRTPKSWSPCPGGAGTPPSTALGSLVPWSGDQGAAYPGQRRSLGWLFWASSIRQEVAWKKTSPGVANAKGCIGVSWPCSLLLSCLPVSSRSSRSPGPWPSSTWHLQSPIDYQLADPIARVALGWSCQNLGQIPAL